MLRSKCDASSSLEMVDNSDSNVRYSPLRPVVGKDASVSDPVERLLKIRRASSPRFGVAVDNWKPRQGRYVCD
jgi:hypothetical protein